MNATSDWIKVRFEEIAENITDRIDKPSESGLEDYIGLDQIDTDQIRIKRFASTADVNATKFLCKKGDIIFGKRNAYLRKVAISDRDAVVSAHSMVLRPIGDLIDPDFLPCLLQSSTFWKVAFSVSEGSMSPTIKWKILAKQEFMIPPIGEQKKIAKLLWAIEDNIEKTENLIAINEKLKKGLLNELLTKGIGHRKFKKTEIGEIPEGWGLVRLSEVIKIIGGGTPKTSNKEYWNGSIPWISVEDLSAENMFVSDTVKKITERGLKESSTKLLQEDDLIISARGTVGLIAKLTKPMAFNQSCYGISKTEKTIIDYIYYLLLKLVEEIKHSSYGSTFKSITRVNFDLFRVALPPINEQEKIAKKLNSFYKFRRSLETRVSVLNNLKKKLTDEILKGNAEI